MSNLHGPGDYENKLNPSNKASQRSGEYDDRPAGRQGDDAGDEDEGWEEPRPPAIEGGPNDGAAKTRGGTPARNALIGVGVGVGVGGVGLLAAGLASGVAGGLRSHLIQAWRTRRQPATLALYPARNTRNRPSR